MFTLFALVPTSELLVLYKDFYRSSMSDLQISTLIDAGKEIADAFLGREWVDDVGVALAIPTSVKLGILKIVDHLTKNRRSNISSISSLSVSKSFFEKDSILVEAYEFLAPHREMGIDFA